MTTFDDVGEDGRNDSDVQELTDQFGNLFRVNKEKDKLSEGGQGVVFREMTDSDIAIKQPIKQSAEILDYDPSLPIRYSRIRMLPLPQGIHLTTPLSVLRNQPGYVMRLLNGMRPLKTFMCTGREEKSLESEKMPAWLEETKSKNRKLSLQLLHCAKTGGARVRMESLYLSAALLARLHLKGIVYGDISENNIFIGENKDSGFSRMEAWLIDVDNLRLERSAGGGWSATLGFGAPELMQGSGFCSPRTDRWSFAVLAFKMLTFFHPFIGKKVKNGNDDDVDWADDNSDATTGMSLEDQAYHGLLPYVYDPEDDTNGYAGDGLPIELVSSKALQRLFIETFGPGRTCPHRRPDMAFWALEFAKAHDLLLNCPGCGMSYFPKENVQCPFCDRPRPAFVIAKIKDRDWEKVFFEGSDRIHPLPHRLFHQFSLSRGADVEYEAEIDFSKRLARPVRGSRSFPRELEFGFVDSTGTCNGKGSAI